MRLTVLSVSMLFLATNVIAQHAHNSGATSELGQSQFAAISRIVTELREAPDTDWAKVDIDALRGHLVDMDNVTTKSVVQKSNVGLQVTFTITGDAAVAGSIKRMVLAHAPMLPTSTGWKVRAQGHKDGAVLNIEVTTQEETKQVLGLGFFGLMTIGGHHQQHHLMIAKGHSPH